MNNYESIDEDELMDVLDNHLCKRRPTASTIHGILEDCLQGNYSGTNVCN